AASYPTLFALSPKFGNSHFISAEAECLPASAAANLLFPKRRIAEESIRDIRRLQPEARELASALGLPFTLGLWREWAELASRAEGPCVPCPQKWLLPISRYSDLPQSPSSSDNTAHVPEHSQAPARNRLRARISNLYSNFPIRYAAFAGRPRRRSPLSASYQAEDHRSLYAGSGPSR